MSEVVKICFKSFVDLFHPKALLIFFLPFFISAFLWISLVYVFYDQWSLFAEGLISWLISKFSSSTSEAWQSGFFSVLSILLFALILPLFWITQVVLSAILAFPLVNAHVRKEYYPQLQQKRGISQLKLLLDTLKASVKYLLLCLLTLPLLLFPVVALVVWAFLGAWLFAKVNLEEVIAEVAESPEEARNVYFQSRDQVRMGVLISSLLTTFVPGFFIISPIYSALLVSHIGLRSLTESRKS